MAENDQPDIKADSPSAALSESKSAIVRNASQAYGYNYASLADIAKAGISIPQMRLKPTEYGEYIEYLDDSGEWQLGAKVVVPEMKGSNAAQTYGSALTYARRYTVQMAKGIACDDDKNLERQPPKQQIEQANPKKPEIDFKKLSNIRRQLINCKSVGQLEAYRQKLSLDDKHWSLLKKDFSLRKQQIEQANPKKPEEAEDEETN